jgi:hypothetical protein
LELRRSEATTVAVMDSLTLADAVDQSLVTADLQRLQAFRGGCTDAWAGAGMRCSSWSMRCWRPRRCRRCRI